jgi:hypothetical protein
MEAFAELGDGGGGCYRCRCFYFWVVRARSLYRPAVADFSTGSVHMFIMHSPQYAQPKNIIWLLARHNGDDGFLAVVLMYNIYK